ncbi:MAG: IPExxxVDY family protein [Bacteroidota bacterium]
MAAIYRITEDFYEDSFDLLALHSPLEDYVLVYRLNLYLKSRFKRAKQDIETTGKVHYPLFQWKDESKDVHWSLICNYSSIPDMGTQDNLFGDSPAFVTYHFIPEQKEVDYFLKVEQGVMDYDKDIVRILNTIPNVITAYPLHTQTLKSKKNLIF